MPNNPKFHLAFTTRTDKGILAEILYKTFFPCPFSGNSRFELAANLSFNIIVKTYYFLGQFINIPAIESISSDHLEMFFRNVHD